MIDSIDLRPTIHRTCVSSTRSEASSDVGFKIAARSSRLRSSPRITAFAVAVDTCSTAPPTKDGFNLATHRTISRFADKHVTSPLSKVIKRSCVAFVAEPPAITGSASSAMIGATLDGVNVVFTVSVLSPNDVS